MSPIDGLDTAGFIVHNLVFLGPAVLILIIGLRPLGQQVDVWARSRGVPLNAETRPWVTARLHRARRWRTVGLALGFLVPYAEYWVRGTAYDGTTTSTGLAMGGYVLGALGAELSARRTLPRSGAAALTARQVDSYLPAWARQSAWMIGAGSVALALVYPLVPLREDTPAPASALQVVWIAALLVAVEVVPRLVVKRRQPFHTPDVLRADDALRSWTAHAVTGVLLSTMFGVLGKQLWVFAYGGDGQAVRWLGAGAGFACLLSGIVVFFYLSAYDNTWRVPRWRRLANP